jgi:hypothetical protein
LVPIWNDTLKSAKILGGALELKRHGQDIERNCGQNIKEKRANTLY